MTLRYVGSGGNDSNNGLSWATRKLTLNGVEDTPVAAGDTVYIGPGIYRETLTCDVSGTAGNFISYIGDYTGANTDGVGGVIRITGSNNDQTATRASCITASGKNYRTFQNIAFDIVTSGNNLINLTTCTYITLSGCNFFNVKIGTSGILVSSGVQSNITITNCFFMMSSYNMMQFTHSSAVDNSGHVISNCIFLGSASNIGIYVAGIGGITFKNNLVFGNFANDILAASQSAGQTFTVNNNIFCGVGVCLNAGAAGQITEDYNSITGYATARSNTSTGANSNTYPPLFDPRWLFQLLTAGAGPNSSAQVVSPFDLASYSALINVAGTSPTTTDIRGTAAQGGQREWGALEYDSTLKLKGGGGGAVTISPSRGGGL